MSTTWTIDSGPGAAAGPARYDGRARIYDRLVRSRLYCGAVWSCRPSDFESFALRATRDGSGPLLDIPAGAGSATARAHATSGRKTTLCDQSSGMLEVAAERVAAAGGDPGRFHLVQSDLFELPFAPGSFETIMSMGLGHIVEPRRIADALLPLLSDGGRLFMSGLVGESPQSRAALHALNRAGETSPPMTFGEMLAGLDGFRLESAWRGGSMAYLVLGRRPTRPGAAP